MLLRFVLGFNSPATIAQLGGSTLSAFLDGGVVPPLLRL